MLKRDVAPGTALVRCEMGEMYMLCVLAILMGDCGIDSGTLADDGGFRRDGVRRPCVSVERGGQKRKMKVSSRLIKMSL